MEYSHTRVAKTTSAPNSQISVWGLNMSLLLQLDVYHGHQL